MAVNLKRSLVAVGVGGVDIGLEYVDERQGWGGSFKSAVDIGRLLLVAGGVGAQIFMPRFSDIGEVVQYAATPLLMQSIRHAVKPHSGKQAATFAARRTGNWIRDANPGSGGYRTSS